GRHTSFPRDWSSAVCSSDLGSATIQTAPLPPPATARADGAAGGAPATSPETPTAAAASPRRGTWTAAPRRRPRPPSATAPPRALDRQRVVEGQGGRHVAAPV